MLDVARAGSEGQPRKSRHFHPLVLVQDLIFGRRARAILRLARREPSHLRIPALASGSADNSPLTSRQLAAIFGGPFLRPPQPLVPGVRQVGSVDAEREPVPAGGSERPPDDPRLHLGANGLGRVPTAVAGEDFRAGVRVRAQDKHRHAPRASAP